MSESNTLVERLRAEEPMGMLSGCCDTVRLVNPDGPEAADLITRLQSDLADLRHDLERAVARETQTLTDLAAAVAERDRMREALERLRQWAEAYPVAVFQEPDVEAVTKLLREAGMLEQMDRLHASWARHLVSGIGDSARQALGEHHG